MKFTKQLTTMNDIPCKLYSCEKVRYWVHGPYPSYKQPLHGCYAAAVKWPDGRFIWEHQFNSEPEAVAWIESEVCK